MELSTAKKIKLLIVDDSILFRSQIQLALSTAAEIEIVGVASNGRIAVDKMACMDIDLCVLDIEMPVLDGIETLKEMKARGIKTKAIMFSAQSKAGAEKTLEAMNLGAVDFVAKPLPDESKQAPADKIREVLLPKVLSLFGPGVGEKLKINKPLTTTFLWETFLPEILVIAASTGGPPALEKYFSLLREPLPFPILITQHMPPVFTASLAERLGQIAGKVAREGIHGETVVANQIYVAPGGYHMHLTGAPGATQIVLDQGPQRNFVRPCADFLFESAAKIYGRRTLGIVFTGMGRDGADGAAVIKAASGGVLIQSEESCVVFGMPGAVHAEGNYDFVGNTTDLAVKTQAVSRVRRASHVA